MPGNVPVSIGLIYTSTAIIAVCMMAFCAVGLYCFYFKKGTPARILNTLAPVMVQQAGAPTSPAAKQLTMHGAEASPGRPRTMATVRAELVETLTRAEALKAELDRIMAAQAIGGPGAMLA